MQSSGPSPRCSPPTHSNLFPSAGSPRTSDPCAFRSLPPQSWTRNFWKSVATLWLPWCQPACQTPVERSWPPKSSLAQLQNKTCGKKGWPHIISTNCVRNSWVVAFLEAFQSAFMIESVPIRSQPPCGHPRECAGKNMHPRQRRPGQCVVRWKWQVGTRTIWNDQTTQEHRSTFAWHVRFGTNETVGGCNTHSETRCDGQATPSTSDEKQRSVPE